jgi:hypothetical protein
MRCPQCGADIPPGGRFCIQCGAATPSHPICPRCGAEISGNSRFCGRCGAVLAGDAPAGAIPPAVPPPTPYTPILQPPVAPSPKAGGCGCLGCGCRTLVVLLVIVLLGAGAWAVLQFRIPQQLGLVKSPAERVLSDTPDRDMAEAIKQAVGKGGIDIKGAETYLLPVAGKDASVLYAVLDAAQGFRFTSVKGKDPIIELMVRLATAEASQKARVSRVAINYRDRNGATLLMLTATTEAIAAIDKGTMSREQFMQKLDGEANWPALYREMLMK